MIRHPDFEVPYPTWTSIVGFLAGWVAVAGLVGAFYVILRG